MIRYRNAAGRVVARSAPDPGLEASKRWSRVEPLSPVPLPEREAEHESDGPGPEPTDSDGDEPEHDENDGDPPSEQE